MRILVSTLCAAVVTLSPVVVGTAEAAPMPTHAVHNAAPQADGLQDLVQVQQRHRYQQQRRGVDRRGHHRPRYDTRSRRSPVHRAPPRQQSRGPDLGSAIVGAIVGGIIVNQFQQSGRTHQHSGHSRSYLSRSHIDWCHNRWRSYRVSDNSYQPYNGPRRVCVSPYGPS